MIAPPSRSASTYPPSPDTRLPAKESLDASRIALLSGHPDQAFRLMLLAEPQLGSQPEWLDLSSRVYLALDKPARVAEAYARLGTTDPQALAQARCILERMGNGPVRPAFKPLGRWPAPDKKVLKSVQAVASGPDGSAYLLEDDALVRVGSDGAVLSTRPLVGARDLGLDFAGLPVALGEGLVLWGDGTIKLPAGIAKPVSAAAAPDGSLFVLERGEARLHRINRKGVSMGSVAVDVGEPVKVRVDRAGRILLADRDGGRVRVYGADMTPVRTLSLAVAGKPLRRIADLALDAAGDLLLLDSGPRQVLLFTASGQLLAATGEGVRADAVGWDGLNTLVVLDRREGALWRYGS